MSISQHILVIRLSAPGDVAMTVPVLHSFQKAFPAVRLTILTNERLAPLFTGLNASLVFARTKEEHRGLAGLFKLFRQLNRDNIQQPFNAVADLHNVLRSRILRLFFFFKGVKAAAIDKGRSGKKQLTRKKNKIRRQLPTSFDRYREVFRNLGFHFEYDFKSIFSATPSLPEPIKILTGQKKTVWIGIAPFAAYREKMYHREKMEEAISQLYQVPGVTLIFFGSNAEAAIIAEWEEKFRGIVNAAGKFTLQQELQLIATLDLMVSMDSANMHFASLVNVPVVAVWGPTHYFAGFLGWNQSVSNAVQIDLYCRPCSVFGNKPCYRGDHACMNQLPSARLVEKVTEVARLF